MQLRFFKRHSSFMTSAVTSCAVDRDVALGHCETIDVQGQIGIMPAFLALLGPHPGRLPAPQCELPWGFTHKETLNAALRNRFHRPSRPKRTGPRDDRALPSDGHFAKRPHSPSGRLGPASTDLPNPKSPQSALRAHEHRVRPADAG